MGTRELPDGWKRLKFREIAVSITERVDDPATSGVERYVGLEHLDPESTTIRRWGSPNDVEATKLRFYLGDVIYGRRRAYQRKLGVADFDGICSAHALVLRAQPDICLPEFLPYFLQSDGFHQRALDISVGSLSPTINWKTLAVQEFALPPIEEQQRIAQLLTALDRSFEVVINSYVKSQSQAMMARRAALNDVFARLTVSGSRHLTLGEVASWSSGGTPKAGVSEFYGGSVPWAVIGDLTNGDVWETSRSLTAAGLASSSAKLVPTGAVLVAMYGSIGKLGIARITLSTNQAIASAIADPRLLRPEYLFWWLRHIEPLLIAQGKGGVQKNISQEVIKRMPIAVPPLGEQDEIVSCLSEMWTSFSAVTTLVAEKVALLSSIRTSARELFLSGRGVACET